MGNKCVKCVLPNLENQDEIQTDSRNKKNTFNSNDFGNSNQNQLETDIKYKQKIENLNQELDNIQSNKYNNKENENKINNENNPNNNDFLKLDNPIT